MWDTHVKSRDRCSINSVFLSNLQEIKYSFEANALKSKHKIFGCKLAGDHHLLAYSQKFYVSILIVEWSVFISKKNRGKKTSFVADIFFPDNKKSEPYSYL